MGYLSCRIYTTSYSNTTWTWMNPDSNWDDNFRVKSTSNFYSGSYNSHTCCFTCILFLQYACTHANSYYHQILRQACFLSHACNINKFRKTSFSCADIACRVTITLYILLFFFKRCTFEPKQISVNLEFQDDHHYQPLPQLAKKPIWRCPSCTNVCGNRYHHTFIYHHYINSFTLVGS